MTDPMSDTNQSFKTSANEEWRSLVAKDGEDEEKVKEGKSALQNLLLSSMQMQNIVVLAGSGTSIGAGGPSMGDLWEACIDDQPEAEGIAGTINHDLEDENIEEFLSRAEAYLQIQEDQTVREFVDGCKGIILEKCTKFLRAESLNAHKTFLHRLSRRRVRDPRLRLFTTNYDRCFEKAASNIGGVVIDGFSFSRPRRYDPRYFSYDIIRRPSSNEDQGNYLEGVFHLYKLHGSVNWTRDKNGSIREKSSPKPSKACLIYPASGKYQQSFLQPYLESISQYLAALREPNSCLIVTGFGFNDSHLSEPIMAAVRSNPHLRVIVVDSKAEESETDSNNEFWKELFNLSSSGEDVCFINATFQQFAELIPDLKSLTPAENLAKAIRNVGAGS